MGGYSKEKAALFLRCRKLVRSVLVISIVSSVIEAACCKVARKLMSRCNAEDSALIMDGVCPDWLTTEEMYKIATEFLPDSAMGFQLPSSSSAAVCPPLAMPAVLPDAVTVPVLGSASSPAMVVRPIGRIRDRGLDLYLQQHRLRLKALAKEQKEEGLHEGKTVEAALKKIGREEFKGLGEAQQNLIFATALQPTQRVRSNAGFFETVSKASSDDVTLKDMVWV